MIFLGPPGVGKTHLSVALAEATIRAGLGAYFITAHDLATDLGRAYREGRLDRRMRVYLAPKVLVIDEVGYLPLDDLGTTIFFQLVSARYERGSITLTSNKNYGDWGSIFGDPIIATAVLDRLLPHSTTNNIRGESYRLKDLRKAGLVPPREQERADVPLLCLGLRSAQSAPENGAGLRCVRGKGDSFMTFRGGEFSTGEMGTLHPALTAELSSPPNHIKERLGTPHLPIPSGCAPSLISLPLRVRTAAAAHEWAVRTLGSKLVQTRAMVAFGSRQGPRGVHRALELRVPPRRAALSELSVPSVALLPECSLGQHHRKPPGALTLASPR